MFNPWNATFMQMANNTMSKSNIIECEKFLMSLYGAIRQDGLSIGVPITNISLLKTKGISVCEDVDKYIFIFYEIDGNPKVEYKNILNKPQGSDLKSDLLSYFNANIGNVVWCISVLKYELNHNQQGTVNYMSKQYFKELISSNMQNKNNYPSDIIDYVANFEEWTNSNKTAFIIMPFDDDDIHTDVVKIIKATLQKHGIRGLRADDRQFADDLFANVKLYMHCCNFGIAIFERIKDDVFNPNVSFEAGYMMGLNKKVCLLKDKTMRDLHTDLVGKLYKSFDTRDIELTLPKQLEAWLRDMGFVERL